jgi:hypothetical protein
MSEDDPDSIATEPRRALRCFSSFVCRGGLAANISLIVFTNFWFRLDGELRCKSLPCDLPFGSASQHKFIPDEFVFACPKKSNQKKRHPDKFALRVPSPFNFAYGPS